MHHADVEEFKMRVIFNGYVAERNAFRKNLLRKYWSLLILRAINILNIV